MRRTTSSSSLRRAAITFSTTDVPIVVSAITTSRRSTAEGARTTSPRLTSRLHIRVIVDACTASRSASALTVCGPVVASTTSDRNCGSVTSSLTADSDRAVMRDECSARPQERVDYRIGRGIGHVESLPAHRSLPGVLGYMVCPSSVARSTDTDPTARGHRRRSPRAAIVGLTGPAAPPTQAAMADLEARLLEVLGPGHVAVRRRRSARTTPTTRR